MMGSRVKLTARQQAVAAMQVRQAVRDAEVAERLDRKRHLDGLAEREAGRGQEVEVALTGRVTVISRDGLVWAVRKGVLGQLHYEAGLRFRADYELANGTGVASSMRDEAGTPSSPFAGGSGVSQGRLLARSAVEAALKSLGTPMLHPYVRWVAGEGEMLSGSRFVVDARRVAEVVLPCRIAFDLLARHYGMLR